MSAMSDYLEQTLLNTVFRAQAYSSPATVYLALYTVAPTDAGGGTQSTGGSYARQSITFGAPAASGGGYQITNTNTITFTNMPSSTVVAFGVFDALTSGNLLVWNTLVTSVVVSAGINLVVSPGDVVITFY